MKKKKRKRICCNIFIVWAIVIKISIIIYFLEIYLLRPVIIALTC